MKILLFIITTISLLCSQNLNEYQKAYGSNIFLLDSKLLNSGKYSDTNTDIENFAINTNYYFKDTNSTYRKFLLGAIGYSKYENPTFNNKSYFFKIGGGLNIKYNPEISNSIGITNTTMFTNADKTFKTSIFNQLGYHKKLENINPYILFTTKYSLFNFDRSSADSINTLDASLKIGAKSNKLLKIWDLPLNCEAYAQTNFLDSNLEKINNYNKLYTLGLVFNWKVGSKLENQYLKNLDIKLLLQGTKSNKEFKGYNVGLGLKIFKF